VVVPPSATACPTPPRRHSLPALAVRQDVIALGSLAAWGLLWASGASPARATFFASAILAGWSSAWSP
jgi:hypothetical protein